MTLFMLFAGFGILIYAGVDLAETTIAAVSDAHLAFGFQFAYLAALSVFFAAVIFLYGKRFPLQRSSRVGRAAPSAWRERIVVVAFLLFGGGIAILIAATGDTGHALACAGQCGGERDAIVGDKSSIPGDSSPSAVVDGESTALAVGMTLFEERGCAGCHRPDSTAVGPALHGLFGSPVQDPACGVAIVDESYLRDAILNPPATVAAGFLPVMPTFAGQLTEEELQALVVYVRSLSGSVQLQRSSSLGPSERIVPSGRP